jgi:hypothetical protein
MTSHASTRALSELSASAIASTLDARNRDALVTAIASLSRRGGGGAVALAMDGAVANGLVRCTRDVARRLRDEARVRRFYALEPRGELPAEDDADAVAFAVRPQLSAMVTIAEHVRGVRDRRERALRERARRAANANRTKTSARDAAASLLTRVASGAMGKSESASRDRASGDAAMDAFSEVPPLPKMCVVCVPRATAMCEDALRELHALEYVEMTSCDAHLIPVEPDVFTLEYPECYSEIVTEEWHACTYYVAAALHKLQRDVTGLAHVVKGKGEIAHKVAQLMLELRLGGQADDEPEHVEPGVDGDSLIDMIVLIDRDVDMVTPLCTQLTYEGLIDEILGIEKGAVAIPKRAFEDEETRERKAREAEANLPEEQRGKMPVRARAHKAGEIAMRPKLNNTDKLFDEIRDLNFGRACNVIRDLATAIKEDYAAIKGSNVEDQHVSEIGDFVKKIKANIGGTGLDLHATLAKYLIDCTKKIWFQDRLECERLCVEGEDLKKVIEHIETMIYRGDEAVPCLRMIVLACICFNGFPPKVHEKLFSDMFNAFGPEIMLKLLALETAGLFVDREAAKKRPRGFAQVRKPLKLVADGVDGSEEPKDITFAYSSSGYAPLSCRIAEAATRGPWKTIAPNNTGEDVLKHLPGDTFEYTQTENDYGRATNTKASYREFNKRREKAAPLDGKDELWPKPTVLVFFIGGVTHAEIACLRHLAKTKECGCNFVVATTKVFNGDALLDTCGEDAERLETRLRVAHDTGGAPPS